MCIFVNLEPKIIWNDRNYSLLFKFLHRSIQQATNLKLNTLCKNCYRWRHNRLSHKMNLKASVHICFFKVNPLNCNWQKRSILFKVQRSNLYVSKLLSLSLCFCKSSKHEESNIAGHFYLQFYETFKETCCRLS